MLTDTGGYTGDIFSRLIEEHLRILELLARAGRDPEALTALAAAIRIHDRAEDETLFKVLDGSYELGRHMRIDHADHAAIERLLRMLRPGDDLAELGGLLTRHFADEELVVFPEARNVVSGPHAADLLHTYELEREFLIRRGAR